MSKEKQRRQLKVHPAILHSVIGAQCGTLGKALLEAVMNSYDAGAKECRVTLGRQHFEVHDNGKGFASQDEIDAWFETFGTPHEEGDAQFGRFRVGRGQLYAFGINEWRSGRFQMRVDYRNQGLEYELTTDLRVVRGCHITVQLYSALSDEDLLKVEDEFRQLVRYAPLTVRLNGKRIGRLPETLKWDLVTPEAYINFDRNKALEVYNQGVYVRSYDASEYGTGGEVVSRIALEVNFARNDVQRYTCKSWPVIEERLRSHAFELVQGKRNLNRGERKFLSRQIGYGEAPKEKSLALDLPLVLDVQGQAHTIREVLEAGRISIGSTKKSRVANKIHEDGVALVLASEMLEQFGLHRYSDEDDLEVLRRLLSTFTRATGLTFQGEIGELASLAQNLRTDYQILEREAQSPELQAMLSSLEEQHNAFLRLFPKANRPVKRELLVGDSALARAWTDGKTYISCTVRELQRAATGNLGEMLALLLLLVHEYGHDESDLDSHDHDHHFYEKYHDMTIYRMPQLTDLALRLSRDTLRRLEQRRSSFGPLENPPPSQEPAREAMSP